MDISILQSPQIDVLAKAMMNVQSELVPVTKDARNTFVGNRYATLTAVVENCRGALERNGIWLSQMPVPAPDAVGPNHLALMTRLYHLKSGQWQASILCTPLAKPDPQAMGSALTYCRRYAICAMLGVLTEDDDGNAATAHRQSQQQPDRHTSQMARQDEPPAWHNEEPDSYQEAPSAPPGLPGVRYELEADNNGRQICVARGKTLPVKDQLKACGFRWDGERKVWWRADAA